MYAVSAKEYQSFLEGRSRFSSFSNLCMIKRTQTLQYLFRAALSLFIAPYTLQAKQERFSSHIM